MAERLKDTSSRPSLRRQVIPVLAKLDSPLVSDAIQLALADAQVDVRASPPCLTWIGFTAIGPTAFCAA